MIEMKDSGYFWIGKIPKAWESQPIKYLLTSEHDSIKVGPFGSQLSGSDFTDEGYWVYNQRSVIDKNFSGNTVFISQEKFDAMRGFHVRSGDILITTRGTIGRICQVPTTFEPGIIHPCIIKFRVDDTRINYEFLERVINDSDLVRTQLLYKSNATTIDVIYSETLRNIVIPIPPMDIQLRIVDYLRPICAELDNIIAKTRASIEEYKKLKQAVITQAVTQGVHSDREMKNSTVEWIEKIPVDWKEQRIKTLFYLRDEKNYLPLEEVNLISLYTDLGVVQHSELEKTTGNKATNADGYKIVYMNDIVVNIILCWMGAIGRSAYNGVTSPAYDIYIPRSSVDSRFYHYYFRTKGFSGDCYKRGKGIMAMRWRTYSDQFGDIKIVHPSLEEQQEIVNYLDQKCSAIDDLIAKKEQYTSEIENYKKSLIYEYVTGKKEVPTGYLA